MYIAEYDSLAVATMTKVLEGRRKCVVVASTSVRDRKRLVVSVDRIVAGLMYWLVQFILQMDSSAEKTKRNTRNSPSSKLVVPKTNAQFAFEHETVYVLRVDKRGKE